MVLKTLKWLPALLLVVMAGSCSGQGKTEEKSAAKTEKAAPENEEGESVYTIYCNPCHGEDGKKGLAGASDLSISKLDQNEIKSVIENGRNTMAAFKGVISKDEIDAVVKYLETLKK